MLFRMNSETLQHSRVEQSSLAVSLKIDSVGPGEAQTSPSDSWAWDLFTIEPGEGSSGQVS